MRDRSVDRIASLAPCRLTKNFSYWEGVSQCAHADRIASLAPVEG
jgi:hypothetical protein